MRALLRFAARLGSFFRKQRWERDMADEIESNVQLHIEENLCAGMSAAEARRAALLKLGGIESAKEAYRDQRSLPWLESFSQDLRYAARSLRKSPGLTAVAVVTLALGVGASTAVFSIVNGVVLRPLPFEEPDRLMWLNEYFPRYDTRVVPGNDFLDWQEQSEAFESIGAWVGGNVNLAHGEDVEQVNQVPVSHSLLRTLRVRPVLGRFFTYEEERNGSRVVMLSEGAWEKRFGRDPSIVGGKLILNEEACTVIGIAPDTLRLIGEGEVIRPLGLRRADPGNPMRLVRVAGRLADGVDVQEARAELVVIARRAHQIAFEEDLPFEAEVVSLRERIVGNVRLSIAVLWAAITLLLLIACLNIANLLLARGSERAREMALRLSLGADRWRVVRQLLTESLLLSLLGSGLGLLVAWKGLSALTALLPPGFPRTHAIQIDTTVLLFTVALAAGCGLFFGTLPALAATKTSLTEVLKSGTRTATGRAGRQRLQSLLVVSEVTLAVLLCVSAGLLVRSFVRLQAVDPGFESGGRLSFWVELPRNKYDQPTAQAAFFERLLGRIRSLPGVTDAATTSALPLSRFRGNATFFTAEGEPAWPPEEGAARRVGLATVGPRAFPVMGIPLLQGKTFEEAPPDTRSIVISRSLARLAFGSDNAVGRRIKFGLQEGDEPWQTVIGVVGDVKHHGLAEEIKPVAYRHYRSGETTRAMAIVVRARVDPLSLMEAIRAEVRSLDPYQPVYDVAMMADRISENTAPQRSRALMLGVAALLALGLAAAGIYGVVSYIVASRTSELGLRVALGAQRQHLLGLIFRKGFGLALTGIALGSVGAVGATRYLESFLFEVNQNDPVTFGAAAVLLVIVAAIACLIPGVRAARLDPVEALRAE